MNATLTEDGDVLLVITSQVQELDWVLDFGCLFEMCAFREQFNNYEA